VCGAIPHDEEVLRTPGLVELTRRQRGVVSASQLRDLGLGPNALERRVRQGWLRRVHRGVYAVGHAPLTFTGRCWAARLATDGVLSHRTAAALWDLLPPPSGALDVTTPRGAETRAGIRVHRSRTALDVEERDGLAVTTVDRTLVDLADLLTPHRLERVVHRAEELRLLDASALRAPGRRTRHLRSALATLATADPDVTRSELEERFLALVAEHGLPRPRANARLHGHEVDFLWPAQRLVVETDGAAAHLTPTAFERDRRRDATLLAAGHQVVRLTWRQVVQEPDVVAAALRARLREG